MKKEKKYIYELTLTTGEKIQVYHECEYDEFVDRIINSVAKILKFKTREYIDDPVSTLDFDHLVAIKSSSIIMVEPIGIKVSSVNEDDQKEQE